MPPYQPTGVPQQGAFPPGPPQMPPQKSGNWFSRNKALVGVLAGVTALVITLGIIFAVMYFSDNSGNNYIAASPTPLVVTTPAPPATPAPTPSPTPTPTALDNTTWELYSMYADGYFYSREDLDYSDTNATFWFSASGDFASYYYDDYGVYYGVWYLTDYSIYVDDYYDPFYLYLDGNIITWPVTDTLTMTFVRNDYISFNMPGDYIDHPDPPIGDSDLTSHPINGFWGFQDGGGINHFEYSWRVVFVGNGDVVMAASRTYDVIWARWQLVSDNEILVMAGGANYYFDIYVDDEMLMLFDNNGKSTTYGRRSFDSPVGQWSFAEQNNLIYFFEYSDYIMFGVSGEPTVNNIIYSDYQDRYVEYFISDNTIIYLYDPIIDRYHKYTFRIEGDLLTLTDENGNWARYRRI